MSYNISRKSQLDTRELLLLESEMKSSGKSMVVAYVLWYFLGMFGGHRFYMGKKGSAVAQLILTCTVIGSFVTVIWMLVDAFTLHTWVKEHNGMIEDGLINQMLAQKAPTMGVSY